jgi:uncharacterized Fe-S cluster protein YjdI
VDGAAHGVDESFRDGQAEPDTGGGVAVAESLERGEHAADRLLGQSGAVVDDAQLDLVAVGAGADRHGWLVVGDPSVAVHVDLAWDGEHTVAQCVVDDVGDDALHQAGIGQHVRQVLVDLHEDRRACVHSGQCAGDDLVVADRAKPGADGAAGQPGGVEQVVDQSGEPVGGLLDGRQ